MRVRRMKASRCIAVVALAIVAGARAHCAEPTAALPPATSRQIDFARDIQPLLQKNCFSCHGSEQQEGGLRLDQRKRALDGGDSGAEIVPGKSSESRLVRMIAGIDEDFGQMPPKEKGKPLSAEEIGLVRAWIDQGARWPDEIQLAAAAAKHWSLKTVVRPALPTVREAAWPKQPIDAFIASRLEKENVRHSPATERTTLLRRLYLDLVGLSPSPE